MSDRNEFLRRFERGGVMGGKPQRQHAPGSVPVTPPWTRHKSGRWTNSGWTVRKTHRATWVAYRRENSCVADRYYSTLRAAKAAVDALIAATPPEPTK